jgi:CheY-like chemotaxis protein
MDTPGRPKGQAGAESAPAVRPVPVQAAAGPAPRREPHVLVVDDHALNRYLVRAALVRLNWQVAQASDGRQALEMIRAGARYDLVLMDLDMPVLDGLAATRWIRAWEAEQPHPPVPIIALTARADRDAEQQCLEAGMNGFIVKPIDTLVLPQVLLQKLRARRRD